MTYNRIFQEFDENSPNGLNAVTLTTLKTQQNVNDHLAKLLMEKERGWFFKQYFYYIKMLYVIYEYSNITNIYTIVNI